ncbi:MAG: hypothetical protein J5961_01975 [Mogibacterium sp.]|nr:hypothetical protein [Mogibacterium sp.]
MRYTVMSADKEVAVVENDRLEILDQKLVPLYLKRTHNFKKWVEDRAIDATRPNSRVLKKAHGLSRMASDFDTAMLYNAASITDNFWVRKGSETWEDVKFDNDLYFKAAVSTDPTVFNRDPSRTPEFTNIGSREKGWRFIDGDWWLYKNEPAENTMFELLTYKIGSSLGFDMACYEMDEGFIRTRDVTKGEVNMQAIDALVYDHNGVTDENMSYNYDTLYDIKPELAKQYMDIKYLDVLVNNVDRHTKNYAVLTSQETGEIISLAPNYDNDMAFYGYPKILNMDRIHGEMKEFLDLAIRVDYDPPRLDVKTITEILQEFDLRDEMKDYLIAGEKVVVTSVKQGQIVKQLKTVQDLALTKGLVTNGEAKLSEDVWE